MNLNERAMLVYLNIRTWNAEREDKKIGDDIAAKYGNDRRMGKFRRYLINPDELTPIKTKCQEMRMRHYALTLPWGDDGARIITSAGFFAYRDEMQAYVDQLGPMFADFVAKYPQMIDDAKLLLNGLWREYEYPKPTVIAGYFSVKTTIRPVPDSFDFRVDLGETDVATIRAQIQEDAQEQIAIAQTETCKRLRNVVEKLGGYVAKGHKPVLLQSTVQAIRDMARTLPGMNIADDARITELVPAVQALGKWDGDVLAESDICKSMIATQAQAVLDKMASYGL